MFDGVPFVSGDSGNDERVLYTDSYVSRVADNEHNWGQTVAKQFVKQVLETLHMSSGELKFGIVWSGPHTCKEEREVMAVNMDKAIDKKMN